MEGTGRFVLGAMFAVVGLIGLGLAAGHEDGALHYVGLLLFLAAVALIFVQLGDIGTGRNEAALPLRPILRNFTRIREQGYEATKTMGPIEKFMYGGVFGVFALLSLFVASRHHEGASYWGGIAFFVICIGLIFYMISGVRHASSNETH